MKFQINHLHHFFHKKRLCIFQRVKLRHPTIIYFSTHLSLKKLFFSSTETVLRIQVYNNNPWNKIFCFWYRIKTAIFFFSSIGFDSTQADFPYEKNVEKYWPLAENSEANLSKTQFFWKFWAHPHLIIENCFSATQPFFKG